jgi:CMP-N,N'-diacetyllegionaminic acid synthase
MIVLGVIPARGGSKGIARKNELPLAGRTLIERAADVARASKVIARTVLTTDSAAIAEIGRRAGIEVVMRPPDLALDDTPMQAVVEHVIQEIERSGWEFDAVALLQPTQPLRRPDHISEAVRILSDTDASSVVGVVAIPAHFSPQYAMRLEGDRLVPYEPDGAGVTRRQDAAAAYSRDGTIYLVRRETINGGSLYGANCRPLLIPADESVNLDSPADWERAEALLAP